MTRRVTLDERLAATNGALLYPSWSAMGLTFDEAFRKFFRSPTIMMPAAFDAEPLARIGHDPLWPFCASVDARADPLLDRKDVARLDSAQLGYSLLGHGTLGSARITDGDSALYLCEVDERHRVFFRLPTGGLGVEPPRESNMATENIGATASRAFRFLERYAQIRKTLVQQLHSLRAVQAFGYAEWTAINANGRVKEGAGEEIDWDALVLFESKTRR